MNVYNSILMRDAILYFDGACLPFNPGGVATYGWAIKFGRERYYGSGVIGEHQTNNVAEYSALIEGMKAALKLSITELIIRGDSQLVIYQMEGIYNVRSPRMKYLYREAKKLEKKFRTVEYQWIPRRFNSVADKLSTQAYIDYMIQKQKPRADAISDAEIMQIDDLHFKVRNYEVDLSVPSCTCPAYKRLNKYYLLRRDNIIVPCKHIIAVMSRKA